MRKQQLIKNSAKPLPLEVDPDGIHEDKSTNIRNKLTTKDDIEL